MENIKNWAFSICSAAICGTLLSIILPEGNIQKIYKTVLNVFFLCMIIAPLSRMDIPDFLTDFKKFGGTDYDIISENEFNQSYIKTTENIIFSETEKILEKYQIKPKDISIKINISDDGSIDISEFTLTLGQNGNLDEIKKEIKEITGIEPEIFISEEK